MQFTANPQNLVKTFVVSLCSMLFFVNIAVAAKGSHIDARELVDDTDGLEVEVALYALKAYQNAHQQGHAKKPYLTIIDYSKPSKDKRMWIIDLEDQKILYELHVTHGVNSGKRMATRFSNKYGSLQTSLGTFVTENTYDGRNGYSLRLEGLEEGINDNAKVRGIVIHGADYARQSHVKQFGFLGRSWGCPAIDDAVNAEVIELLQDGSVVFSYYPDEMWLASSDFIKKSGQDA